MSMNLNKVIIGGRLTADPELKLTQSGVAVTSFSIAVDRKTAKDAEKKTDFIPIVAWRGTAEFITKYFGKGSAICIVGKIQTRSWQDQNGDKRYATEVIADESYFVESKTTSDRNTQDNVVKSMDVPLEDLSDDDDLPF